MTNYTDTQIRYIRSQAHHLKPIIWIGQKGLTDPLVENITEALRVHELVKIKFHEKDDIERLLPHIIERSASTHIQTIGKIITLYKRNNKKPKIKLAPEDNES